MTYPSSVRYPPWGMAQRQEISNQTMTAVSQRVRTHLKFLLDLLKLREELRIGLVGGHDGRVYGQMMR